MILVLTTLPTKRSAEKLAGFLLQKKLAACVSVTASLESHYVWKGKQEKSREFLVLAKTSTRKTLTLERLWSRLHPYDCPELITLSGRAAVSYARWIQAST